MEPTRSAADPTRKSAPSATDHGSYATAPEASKRVNAGMTVGGHGAITRRSR